jgi:hypothetical protein
VVRVLKRISLTNVAYVCLLLGFVALGTFVYALAVQSPLTAMIGAVLVVLLAASAVGFRAGARKRAESNDSGITIEGVNVWARPLRRDEIEQYLASYRGVRDGHAQMLKAVATPAAEPATVDRWAA